MDLKLKGKVVLITGGGSGIGKATALAFLKEGCKVAICGRTKAKVDNTVEEFQEKGYDIIGRTADAGNSVAMNAFADVVARKYGGIDVWINNAGIYPQKALLDVTEDEWDETFRVNVKSVFIGTKIAAAHMKKQGKGVILNASSLAAVIPSAGSSVYAATKSAIASLTRTSAAELAPFHIRVVAYMPGVIRTDITGPLITAKRQFLTEQIALGRLGETEDIAATLVFLASDSAAYITGNSVEISGGKFCVQNPQYAWQSAATSKNIREAVPLLLSPEK